jgi:6-phosphogluconate dehydrogenase
MKDNSFDMGMVGLGVMGRNFVLNIADSGYSVAGLDNNKDKAAALEDEASEYDVSGTTDSKAFIASLKKPRAVMMLVPAGKAVDSVIDELVPLLDEGDLIVDGGNSQYTDTNCRVKKLNEHGIHFMGVGISGGEEGARNGPSIMPGGSEEAYDRIQPIFEGAAAEVDGEPCVRWLGPGSAGHYVKMVHNGIEYGVMQLIAECYDIMKRGLGFENERIQQVFADWNDGELSSFLMEITADIFAQPDNQGDGMLIDAILDNAKQKGTGKWASQDAMDLKVPLHTIDMAVAMRDMSSYKEERVDAEETLVGPKTDVDINEDDFINELRDAMYFSMMVTYAQGIALLTKASEEYEYNLNFEDIATIWRGGCIIRAELLDDITKAYRKDPKLVNLMVDEELSKSLMGIQASLRTVVSNTAAMGIPAPGLMTSLAYYDSYRSGFLPANLIQAQRDNFGSHTFERKDQDGSFHSEWNHNL